MKSEVFLETNIHGEKVTIKKLYFEDKSESWFCAYATLLGSKVMSDEFLGYPTLREEDYVGVDTTHSHNEKMTEAQKLADAITQIEEVIRKWKEVVRA